MQQDSDAGTGSEPANKEMPRGWRLWICSPPHLIVTSAGVVLAGLLLGYLFAVGIALPPQDLAGDLRRVPDVIGRTAEAARGAIERAGLAFEEAPGLYHSGPPGTVLAQEPLPGQMARPGSSVAVTLSRGPRERPVPDVTGLTHGQASVALSRAGYRSEVVWVDAEADVGLVVSTRPAPGTPLELPGSVRLLVSAGPREAPVPELSGSSVAEARAALERLGLKLGTVTQDSTSLAAAGTVMSQEPPPGTVAARGTEVSVVVAVGVPQPVETVDTTEVPADSFWIGL